MHRLLGTVVAAAVLLAMPSASFAQAKKGDKEVSVSGNVSTVFTPKTEFAGFGAGGGTSTSGTAFLGFGVFVTDRTQIGFAPFLSISQGEDGIDASMGGSFDWQYYLGGQSSRVKPYVGYSVLISSFTVQEGGSLADNMYNAGLFGVKNYFSERAALDFQGSYGFGMRTSDTQRLNFRIGLSYLF